MNVEPPPPPSAPSNENRGFSPVVKRSGREVNHFTTTVTDKYMYTSTSFLRLHGLCKENFNLFTLQSFYDRTLHRGQEEMVMCLYVSLITKTLRQVQTVRVWNAQEKQHFHWFPFNLYLLFHSALPQNIVEVSVAPKED
jgi:hypothetical protein